jgi:hypothetical protein
MERLALCSKILYDIDLLDKKNEIDKLNKIINIPKLSFKNEEEFINAKNTMYNIIQKSVWDCVVQNDDFEYYNSPYEGLNSQQRNYINKIMNEELNKFTSELDLKKKQNISQKWCENISFDIIYNIEGSLQGLVDVGKINNFSEFEIALFIYRNIIWELEKSFDQYNDEIFKYKNK